jgi:hypothetical protein
MIQSTSSTDRSTAADPVAAAGLAASRSVKPQPDRISTQGAAFLEAALASQPEVRPGEVARAAALAADPSYPSADIMRSIAGKILASPDLSEDES